MSNKTQEDHHQFYQEIMQKGGLSMLHHHDYQTAAGVAASSAQLDVRFSQGKIHYDTMGAVDIETHTRPPMILMREIKF